MNGHHAAATRPYRTRLIGQLAFSFCRPQMNRGWERLCTTRGRHGTIYSHHLGLDPRGLHFNRHFSKVKSPRVRPEGDDLWAGEIVHDPWIGEMVQNMRAGLPLFPHLRVIPAKAGTSVSSLPSPTEVPDFAGMTWWRVYRKQNLKRPPAMCGEVYEPAFWPAME